MSKLLNIDALSPVEKQIQIKGQLYDVVERTVEQVVNAIKAEKELEKEEDGSELKRVEMFVNMVRLAIPDCPVEILRNLPVRTLMVILTYINDNEEVEEPETGK